jgi:hypothetical protein
MMSGATESTVSVTSVMASSILDTEAMQSGDSDNSSSIENILGTSLLSSSDEFNSSSSGESSQAEEESVRNLMRYGLSITSNAASQANLALMARPGLMWNELDQRMKGVESQIQGDLIVVGAAGAATSSFMVGVAAWGLRTGFLASGLLAQLPAWRAVDPLLIMQGSGDGDDESLEDLMKRRSDELDGLNALENTADGDNS